MAKNENVAVSKEEKKVNPLVEKMKKSHAAQAIQKKDYSLSEIVNKKNPETELEIVSFSSKFVSKYCNENNPGYHTTITLSNGEKTGCFSSALFDFAKFFYEGVGIQIEHFAQVTFNAPIKVKVSYVALDGGHSTYNFEIEDSEVTEIERLGGSQEMSLLLDAAK